MRSHLWYSQLDAYDAVRRMALLLMNLGGSVRSQERLFILDFYLATPSLLHNASLPQQVRDAFRRLKVQRPEASFVSLPSPAILFQKMAEVQNTAFRTMVGTGLLSADAAEGGIVTCSDSGTQLFAKLQLIATASEIAFAEFLCADLAYVGGGEIGELRRRTGLRRLSR